MIFGILVIFLGYVLKLEPSPFWVGILMFVVGAAMLFYG